MARSLHTFPIKSYTKGTDKQHTDIATYRLNWSRDGCSEGSINSSGVAGTNTVVIRSLQTLLLQNLGNSATPKQESSRFEEEKIPPQEAPTVFNLEEKKVIKK